MKKTVKAISLFLVTSLMMVLFAACAPSKEEVVGTYSGSYTYDGNSFNVAIVLSPDGTYSKASAKNGEFPSSETGDYEIKGRKIILYNSDSAVYHGSSITYKYKKGVLENNKHKFYKQ